MRLVPSARLRRALAAAAGCALAAAALAATATATTAPASTCTVSGRAISGVAASTVVSTNATVAVYRVRSSGDDLWWACRRGSGARVLLGRDDTFQNRTLAYGPSATMTGLAIAGNWVIALQGAGASSFANCSKHGYYPCPSPVTTLVVADLATPATGILATVDSDVTDAAADSTVAVVARALVSPAGAVAWLVQSTATTHATGATHTTAALEGCLATSAAASGVSCTPRQLATGAISASSLALSGARLSWSAAGASGSATVR